MKKLFSIMLAAIMLLAYSAEAQVNLPKSYNTYISVKDTLTNADTTASTVVIVPTGKSGLTFQVNVTKISGTVAGTITLYGSIDNGVSYVAIATDTLTNTTGTKSYGVSYVYSPYKKYKYEVITSGTVSAAVQRWVYYQ